MKMILASSLASLVVSVFALCLAGCPDEPKADGADAQPAATATSIPSAAPSATVATTATSIPSGAPSATAPQAGDASAAAPIADASTGLAAKDAGKPAAKK